MCKSISVLLLMLVSSGAWSQGIANKSDANVAYFEQEQALASGGDLKAQVCVGDLYMWGSGTPRDLNAAMKMYQSASDAGDQLGMLRIGQAYAWGTTVPKDTAKGIEIFRNLMSHGYMPAASQLAVLYDQGDGVPKDYAKALDLLRKAAAAGDYWAEVRLGLFYHWGDDGVNKDEAEAQRWLHKAANHHIDCFTEFGNLTNFIINGYMKPLDTKDKSPTGTLRIKYTYHNGRAENVVVLISSGRPAFDQVWLDATRIADLPPWPASFHTDDKTLGFLIPGDDSGLESAFIAAVRDAIHKVAQLPKEVLVNGSKGTGLATVSFDYLDGKASNAKIVTSSDDVFEDAAAITAVENAEYPPTPDAYLHKKLNLSISLNFGGYSPTKSVTTVNAPAAATIR